MVSKIVERFTYKVTTKLILETLAKFTLSKNHVLVFATNGSSRMRCIGRVFKEVCGNLVRVKFIRYIIWQKLLDDVIG